MRRRAVRALSALDARRIASRPPRSRVPPLHAATAFIEGDAIYLERILPPPNAKLIVALQDTARADAPAIERASVSMQIAGGPPYAWRLPYDPQLGEPAG